MEGVFDIILERGIAAGFLVLAVVLLRLVFKKMPKWFRLVLWGLVAFRLVCPFSFESAFSLMPDVSRISEELEEKVLQEEEAVLPSEEEKMPLAEKENPDIQELPLIGNESLSGATENPADTGNVTVDSINNLTGNISNKEEQNTAQNTTVTELTTSERNPLWQQIEQNPMPYIWLLGFLLMVLYGVVSYFKVKHQVKASWNVKENIFYCDDIDTPFVFGLVKPRIYLPSGIEEVTAEYVLRHEKEHLRRGDQWWKLLGFGLLAIYWFHPALWVAYVLFCKDIEFACDERIIKGWEETSRREYAQALLKCSIGKRIILLCPTAFGENGVKGRIRSVMTYKKATIPVLIVAVLLCVVVGAVFLTDRRDAYGIEREHLTLETDALDEKTAEQIAEDIAALMVEAGEGIYQLENFRFNFCELESGQANRTLRVSVEADRTSLRAQEDSPVIQSMKQAQSELTYEAERTYAQTMIDSMLLQLKQEAEVRICEPAILVTLDENKHYELYYGDANRTPLQDYFKKEDAEKEQFLGYLSIYQRANIQPPLETTGSSGYVYTAALKNPETLRVGDGSTISGVNWSNPYLYYNEAVYDDIIEYIVKDSKKLPWELLGEELKVAYSNDARYWSERDALTACTGNGTLYAVKGYEDSYRVAVVYEENWREEYYTGYNALTYRTLIFQSVIGEAGEEIAPEKTTYHMVICEHVNNLWLHKGREVFQQRWHLENTIAVNGLSMEDELFWTFLAELNDATFLHPNSGALTEFTTSEGQTVTFEDSLGFEHSIDLYEGGYVMAELGETGLVAKIDEEVCRLVMERVEAYEEQRPLVSFEDAFPVASVFNQEEGFGETYSQLLELAKILLFSENLASSWFGEDGYYISKVPVYSYSNLAGALDDGVKLLLLSKRFDKLEAVWLGWSYGEPTVVWSSWYPDVLELMKENPTEEFILIDGVATATGLPGIVVLDEENTVRWESWKAGSEFTPEENLYQKLYSDELAISYEELTAEENLIWIPVKEGAAMATPSPTPTPVDTSGRSYREDYEGYSYVVYPAEEWMKTGRLEVPFSREDMLSRQNIYERFVMYYIPEEALTAATTADLLRVACEWPFAAYDVYNYPSYYLDFISEKFNGMDELFSREDFAAVLLKEYQAAGFYVTSGRTAGTSEEEYTKEAAVKENSIVLMEILLATNEVFDQLTHNERAMVLAAVSEKMMMRKSGLCLADEKVSGLFAYVKENSLLGNKWYDYIMEDGYAGWISYLDNAAYPMDHVPVEPKTDF